jgi:Holliday junction resolvasome RuvABC endonuclease subunit
MLKARKIKKSKDMHILTIDQSLNGSGCIYTINGIIKGKWYMTQYRRNLSEFGTFIDTKNINSYERLALIKQWFTVILSKVSKDTYMALEGYAYGGVGKVFELGELGGLIKLMMFEQGFRFMIIPPDSAKLFGTGKGIAPKSVMVANCYIQHEIDFSIYAENGEDLADAFWLNKVVEAILVIRRSPELLKRMPEHQRNAIANRKGKKQNPSLLEMGFIRKK